MSELPKGWSSASVADLIAPDGIFSDGDWVESKDQDPFGAIRLLQLADVGDGVFVDKSNRFINDKKFEQLRCTEVFEGDVLIARMPDPLGRACLAPKLRQRCITVVDVAIVRPGPSSVSPKWLMHCLNAPPVREVIELQSSGTTRRRISRGNLAQLELPVPPLAEQKRIADKLDALLARVAACRERLDRVPDILNRFRQSVLTAAVRGELTREWREERGLELEWTQATLGSLLTDIRYGTAKKCAYDPRKTPVLRIPNVADGMISHDDMKYADFDEEEKAKLALAPGDLLMIRSNGSVGLVGRTALVSKREAGFLYAGYLIRLRPDAAQASPGYLSLFLASPVSRTRIELTARSTTGVNNINAEEIRAFPVDLPSLDEQYEIVRRVDGLLAMAMRLDDRVSSAQTIVKRTTPSALNKAFLGELVPQDPSDAPASELLTKLKEAQFRAAAEPSRRRRKTPRKRPTMSSTDKDTIKAAILKLKLDRFSFDELRAQVAGDYESLKAALFELLEEPSPVVRQVFDKKAKAMQFVRVRP